MSAWRAYKYELEACNQVGCVPNAVRLALSVDTKHPELFKLDSFNVSYSSIQLNWRLPARPNGVLERFVVVLKETVEEIHIGFSFGVENVSSRVSVTNMTSVERLFSADSLFVTGTVYSLVLADLVPNTKYSIKLSACNRAGCVEANTPDDTPTDFIQLITDDYHLSGLRDPVVYVIDDETLDLVWQEPEQINGQLTSFKLYRNNMFLVQFDFNQTNISNSKLSILRI